jgi:hypothetical protein
LLPWFAAELPGLRPPRGELPPSGWEQHGGSCLALSILALAAIGYLVWRWRRPQPAVAPPPHLRARQALEARRQRPVDAALVREIAQILRDDVRAGLPPPPEELTTEQLMAALKRSPMPADTRQAIGDFLRECDTVKFALPSPAPDPDLLARALALVDALEASQQPPSTAVPTRMPASADSSAPA